MSKFDLEKALKGEPVVLRDGRKAYVRHRETDLTVGYPLLGYTEHGDIMSWTVKGDAYRSRGGISIYDIVGMWVEPPLVFEYWDLLIEDIKYLAKDRDGDWVGYDEKPSKVEGFWAAQNLDGYYSVGSLKKTAFPDCDWENSLIERSENE